MPDPAPLAVMLERIGSGWAWSVVSADPAEGTLATGEAATCGEAGRAAEDERARLAERKQ